MQIDLNKAEATVLLYCVKLTLPRRFTGILAPHMAKAKEDLVMAIDKLQKVIEAIASDDEKIRVKLYAAICECDVSAFDWALSEKAVQFIHALQSDTECKRVIWSLISRSPEKRI